MSVTLTPIEVPSPLVLSAGALALLALAAALRGIQWSRLRDFEAQSVYAVMLAVAVAARLARIELQPGLDLHLFGASAAALMFGWRFALLQQAAAVATVALGWGHFWLHPVLDFVYTGVIPVLLTTALLDFAQKRMPLHLFVYLLFNGFFAGALAIALVQLAKLATLLMLGTYALDTLGENFLLTVPALMFPEGFATGALLTMFVAYRPRWVATFHDASYLGVRGAG
ncbi:MAG: energy-coupling factor ABC transporter permease [Rhodanobacteraceae bacterium]|nr:energy-coupling factor ABC transporter permease [Rhodanobacteraceae bacterium]